MAKLDRATCLVHHIILLSCSTLFKKEWCKCIVWLGRFDWRYLTSCWLALEHSVNMDFYTQFSIQAAETACRGLLSLLILLLCPTWSVTDVNIVSSGTAKFQRRHEQSVRTPCERAGRHDVPRGVRDVFGVLSHEQRPSSKVNNWLNADLIDQEIFYCKPL